MKSSNEKNLKRKLLQKRKNVKNKLTLLKQGELAQEQMFSPITKQLQNIQHELKGKPPQPSSIATAATTQNNEQGIAAAAEAKLIDAYNNEDVFVGKDEAPPLYAETPRNYNRKRPKLESRSSSSSSNVFRQRYTNNDKKEEQEEEEDQDISFDKKSILESITANDNDDDDDEDGRNTSRFEELARNSLSEYLDQYDPLPRKYVAALHEDIDKKEFDHKYGIRMDPETEKFYVGDSSVNIDGNDVIVKKKRYKGTRGLYELLFKKNPVGYTVDDEKNYRQIILKTNAHRRYYQSNKQIDGSRLTKYKQIIGPYVTGKGIFVESNKNKIDYVHWDDPNELVARLRLLLSSQQAGHTGHTNEITSIVEELKEAGIIA